MKVFVSHSTLDQAIAAALKMLLIATFGQENIELVFSSDEDGGGIPAGKDWLKWIKDNIKDADLTLVLVTPKSVVSPWVMWEGGVATGVALGTNKDQGVVPIVFSVQNDKIPSPFNAVQLVRGDEKGIAKLLQDIRQIYIQQGMPFPPIDASIEAYAPRFLEIVKSVIAESAEPILSTIPSLFDAGMLSGYWVSCYDFGTKCHADIAHIIATSPRNMRISNNPPNPRTEGHDAQPYCNVIEAEVVNRHLVGHWKNVTDTRYFGTVHLAVRPSDNNMIGHYTSFDNDVKVGGGPWRWTRLDPKTMHNVDLETIKLRSPREIRKSIMDQLNSGERLSLNLIAESPQ